MRHHRRRSLQGETELNLAAMLDMAFQLLAFFILTYRPAQLEGEIELRVPPLAAADPRALQEPAEPVGTPGTIDVLQGLDVLVIDVHADADGSIGRLRLGQRTVGSLENLEARLHAALANRTAPFTRVAIHADPRLRYDALMSVIELCTRQRTADGQPLQRLGFSELTEDFEG